ncbi:MAG: thioesterase family protein [Pseudomonadota bacterium]
MLTRETAQVDGLVYDFVNEFVNSIPFNSFLGFELVALENERLQFTLAMRDELVGNFVHGILHGGVISSLIDTAGGTMALVAALTRDPESERHAVLSRLAKSGTIDMRVDFLRPGRGAEFRCTANLIRCGRKVAVVRTDFENELDELVAVGTGSYLCS